MIHTMLIILLGLLVLVAFGYVVAFLCIAGFVTFEALQGAAFTRQLRRRMRLERDEERRFNRETGN